MKTAEVEIANLFMLIVAGAMKNMSGVSKSQVALMRVRVNEWLDALEDEATT